MDFVKSICYTSRCSGSSGADEDFVVMVTNSDRLMLADGSEVM